MTHVNVCPDCVQDQWEGVAKPSVTSSPAEVREGEADARRAGRPVVGHDDRSRGGRELTIGCVDGRCTETRGRRSAASSGRVRVTVSGSGSGCCSGVVDVTVTVAVVLAACAVGVADTATGTEV